MDDVQALTWADRWLADGRRRTDAIRAQGVNLVLEHRGFHRRGLQLLHSALMIGIRRPTNDPKHKAVLGLASTQIELLTAGWETTLDGYYAAAAVPSRLTSELSDYVPAAGVDERIAERILNDDKVQVGEARKSLVRNLEDLRSNPTVADVWAKRRMAQLDALNGVAHARAPLLMGAGHLRGATLHVGHEFDPVSLWAIACEYAQLTVNATVGIGVALSASLPDGQPWSDEQRRLLKDWKDFLDAGAGRPPEVDRHKAEIDRIKAPLSKALAEG
jgi:hypothetical protein